MQTPAQIAHVSDSVLIALRAQLELTRAFQADLLSTVYWSLGVLVLIVAVLVGFGWFANFRVYQRDLDALRRELEATVTKSIVEMRAALQASLAEQLTASKQELQQVLSAKIDGIALDLLRLQVEFFQFEFDTRVGNKNYTMAVTSALRLLGSAIDLKWDFFINLALTGIVDSINNGGRLTLTELQSATNLLMRLPDSYAVLRERARVALAKAPTV